MPTTWSHFDPATPFQKWSSGSLSIYAHSPLSGRAAVDTADFVGLGEAIEPAQL